MKQPYLHEMPSGDLVADPGGPVPDVPKGYTRDTEDPHRLHLAIEPKACEHRRVRHCPNGRHCRYRCMKKDGLPVNPGVCARCQGLLAPLE